MNKNLVCFYIISRKLSCASSSRVIENSGGRATEANNDGVTVETGRGLVPTKIENLLNEYQDIIVEDIPNGLQPVRIISHYMDLLPRASFMNKAPYRLTPTKNEELNKQVY